MARREFARNVGSDGGHAERLLLGGTRQFPGQQFREYSTARSNGVENDPTGEILGGGARGMTFCFIIRNCSNRRFMATSFPELR
jgi:hypothetical protein